MKTQVMDRISEMSGKATVGVGAVSAAWGWFRAEHLFSALGVLVGLLGAGITWYYKRKADARHEQRAALERELLQVRIEQLRQGASAQALRVDTDWGKEPEAEV